jgi:hypothetical protein
MYEVQIGFSSDHSPWCSMYQVQIGFSMTASEDIKSLAVSLGELKVEASPSSPSREKEVDWLGAP